ncbi:MAG: hypothetical protein D6698_16195, partial [Gammaproteobacteria bacterium]
MVVFSRKRIADVAVLLLFLASLSLLPSPAFAALDLTRSDYGIPGPISEETRIIPCGQYTYTDVITQSGTPDKWIRYKAEQPFCVNIAGGNTPSNRQYYILDGVVIDGRRTSDNTGFSLKSDNVGIENSEIIGKQDVFTDESDCKEGSPGGTGLSFNGYSNVWAHRVEIHGFNYGIFSGNYPTRMRVTESYIHNVFNGIGPKGTDVVFARNVLWMAPNHGILIEDNAPDGHNVRFERNLIVDTQEGSFHYGGAAYEFIGNTWWDSTEMKCGVGISPQILDRSPSGPYGGTNVLPRGPITFYDNVFDGHTVDVSNLMRFEMNPLSVLGGMDYNLLHRPEAGSLNSKWVKQSWPSASYRIWTLDEWRSETGFDQHSQIVKESPQFADPRILPIPEDYDEAWNRFRPLPGSILCGAGRNGGDLGAVPCGSCTPKTCAEVNAECGNPPDGCGGYLDCGSCPQGDICGGGGTPYQCWSCTPSTEVCDGVDNDCDSQIDEGFDSDGDGFFAEGCSGYAELDCDDGDAGVHPGAVEVCGNGVDEDCDGVAQECVCSDGDGDGFGVA